MALPCPFMALSHRDDEVLSADPAGIARAATLLRAGALVAFGYRNGLRTGCGCDQRARGGRDIRGQGPSAFQSVDLPLSRCADAAFAQVQANAIAHRLAAAFWPGPLDAWCCRAAPTVPWLAGRRRAGYAGGARAGSLISHWRCCARWARPVAAPSANRSGQVSPTTAQHVLDGLTGRIAAVLDSGPCGVGVESTVLDLTGARPFLLRPGGATVEAIEALVGPVASRHPARGGSKQRARCDRRDCWSRTTRPAAGAAGRSGRAHDEALLAFGAELPGAAVTFNSAPAAI